MVVQGTRQPGEMENCETAKKVEGSIESITVLYTNMDSYINKRKEFTVNCFWKH
jgi:hypothetical protein